VSSWMQLMNMRISPSSQVISPPEMPSFRHEPSQVDRVVMVHLTRMKKWNWLVPETDGGTDFLLHIYPTGTGVVLTHHKQASNDDKLRSYNGAEELAKASH